jgi:hypothetical protein
MLYPLSYEGLRRTFAQHAGLVSCRWARAGYLVPTACAAPMPRAVGQRPTTAPARGADYTASGSGSSLQPVVVMEGPRHPRVLGRFSVARTVCSWSRCGDFNLGVGGVRW